MPAQHPSWLQRLLGTAVQRVQQVQRVQRVQRPSSAVSQQLQRLRGTAVGAAQVRAGAFP